MERILVAAGRMIFDRRGYLVLFETEIWKFEIENCCISGRNNLWNGTFQKGMVQWPSSYILHWKVFEALVSWFYILWWSLEPMNHWPTIRNNDDSTVATGMNYGHASFPSWSKSICNPKMGLQGLEAHDECCFLSKVNTSNGAKTRGPAPIFPKGKPLASHMVSWQHPVHPDTPTMIGWPIGN